MKRTMVALTILMLFVCAGISVAQDTSKSDVAVNYTGVLSKESTGDSITVKPTQASGFLASYRYNFARNSAVEVNYGYSRNTQKYVSGSTTTGVNTNLHEFTAAYVYKFHTGSKFQPFVLAGTGALLFDPTDNGKAALSGVSRQAKPVFLYGGGFDYSLTKFAAMRAQYRGLLYKTPDFSVSALDASATGHLAEPSIGIVFRF